MDAVLSSSGSIQSTQVPLTFDTSPVLPGQDNLGLLTEGQLIKATVQQIIGSVVWLKAEGQTLQARTQVPLQPEQQVLLKVIEVNPLRVNLQLQTSNPQNSPLDLPTILNSWGIQADEINLNIAQALLKNTQSVTPDDIQTIRTLWRSLPSLLSSPNTGETEQSVQIEQLNALTYLHTNNLPISKETIASAQRWLNGLPPVTERLTELQLSLDDALEHLKNSEVDTRQINQIREVLLSMRSQLANLKVSPQQPLQEVIISLADVATQLGTPPEAEVASLLLNNKSSAILANLQNTLSSSGQLTMVRPTEFDQSTLANPLHHLAKIVTEALAQIDLETPIAQAFHRLAERSDQLAGDLTAMHLSNLTNIQNSATDAYYYIPIPLTTPDGPRTAQLKVYQQSGQKQLDPRNLSLALLLELPSLGDIAINLTIFERHLSGQILSGQLQTHHQVEAELSQLYDALNGLGYRVESLTCDLLTKPKPEVQRSTFNRVDVSV